MTRRRIVLAAAFVFFVCSCDYVFFGWFYW